MRSLILLLATTALADQCAPEITTPEPCTDAEYQATAQAMCMSQSRVNCGDMAAMSKVCKSYTATVTAGDGVCLADCTDCVCEDKNHTWHVSDGDIDIPDFQTL